MSITTADVRHLARLASLALDEAALAHHAEGLNAIVGYVEQLRAVDTTGIAPVCDMSGTVGVVRADEPTGHLPLATILANAPLHNDTAFLVPKVVER